MNRWSDNVSDPIRVGFIGTGGNARGHIRQVAQIEGTEVVAFADPSERALEAAQEHIDGTVPTFADYIEMLDSVEMDGVVISTPHTLHYEQVMAALERGIHVEIALRFQAPELVSPLTVAIDAHTTMGGAPVGSIELPKLVVTEEDGTYVTSVVPVIFEEDLAGAYLGDPPTLEGATVCAALTLPDDRAAVVCQQVTLVDEL